MVAAEGQVEIAKSLETWLVRMPERTLEPV
jgi:hypothetical protein